MFAILGYVWKTWNVFNSNNFHLLSSSDGLVGHNQSTLHWLLWAEEGSEKQQEIEEKAMSQERKYAA